MARAGRLVGSSPVVGRVAHADPPRGTRPHGGRGNRRGHGRAGASRDPGARGAGPQPARRRRRPAPRPPGGPDRRQRLGQELAGVRYALRRGPEALHRGPLRVRPPVPRPARTPRRRPRRGPAADRLDRPEGRVVEPEEHGRDRHRDPRLPPPALRPHGHPALPELRPGDPPPDARADGRRGARHAAGAQGARPGPPGPRAQGAAPRRLPGDPARRPAPGAGRRAGRRDPGRPSQAGQDQAARHRGGRRSAGRPRRHPAEAGRERRPGPEARRGLDPPLGAGRGGLGGPPPERQLRLPLVRRRVRGAGAAHLQLQQPLRRLPDLRRPGHPGLVRPRPRHPRPITIAGRMGMPTVARIPQAGPQTWGARPVARELFDAAPPIHGYAVRLMVGRGLPPVP